LISNFYTTTALAGVVVVIKLMAITDIQWKHMDIQPVSAAARVMLVDGLVLASGILLGTS
jgi:hypothetical protein